jgi:hypothetical protein
METAKQQKLKKSPPVRSRKQITLLAGARSLVISTVCVYRPNITYGSSLLIFVHFISTMSNNLH